MMARMALNEFNLSVCLSYFLTVVDLKLSIFSSSSLCPSVLLSVCLRGFIFNLSGALLLIKPLVCLSYCLSVLLSFCLSQGFHCQLAWCLALDETPGLSVCLTVCLCYCPSVCLRGFIVN